MAHGANRHASMLYMHGHASLHFHIQERPPESSASCPLSTARQRCRKSASPGCDTSPVTVLMMLTLEFRV